VTAGNENWHTNYSCPGERYTNLSTPFCFRVKSPYEMPAGQDTAPYRMQNCEKSVKNKYQIS